MLHTVFWKSSAENVLRKTVIDLFESPQFFYNILGLGFYAVDQSKSNSI